MKNKIWKILTAIAVIFTLVGCEGDFTFDQATVVSKSIVEPANVMNYGRYTVTVAVSGKLYTVPVFSKDYYLVNENSVVRVKYTDSNDIAKLTPAP